MGPSRHVAKWPDDETVTKPLLAKWPAGDPACFASWPNGQERDWTCFGLWPNGQQVPMSKWSIPPSDCARLVAAFRPGPC